MTAGANSGAPACGSATALATRRGQAMQVLPECLQVALLVIEGMGPGSQASLAVHLLGVIREHQDFRSLMVRTYFAQDLQPAAIDELDIEQNDVRRVASQAFDRRRGTGELAHHFGTCHLREHLAQHLSGNG